MNPYLHPRLKRLKRSSKFRYGLALLILLPQYFVWRLSRLIPESFGRKLRRRFGFLWVPMEQVIGLFRLWLLTRIWKKLLLALPLLLALAWLISILYLANNQSDEELYGDYRRGLMSAVGAGEYELADFLAGKLLRQGSFDDDQQMLYAAMLAAQGNQNIPRRDLLLNRLTKESHYGPAHMWYARLLHAQPDATFATLLVAIQHVQEALKVSDNSESIRVDLASLYYEVRRTQQAIRVLEGLSNPAPRSSVLLAKLYMLAGATGKARSTADELLQQLELEDPTMRQWLIERVDAVTVLADMRWEPSAVLKKLAELASVLENKSVFNPENEGYRVLLSQVYMVRARVRLEQIDDNTRSLALADLQKAIATGKVPNRMGAMVFSASNLNSRGGLTDVQMRLALVQGQGVAVAHMFLGLDAWKKDLMQKAEFHFQLAYAMEPEILTVVGYVATHIARSSTEGVLDPLRLSLESEELWSRSIRLLELSSKIDARRLDTNLRTQCFILSSRQRWTNIMEVLEPRIDQAADEFRYDFLKLLVSACQETGNMNKLELYSEMLRTELQRLAD